jgi:hypothetical protein
MIWSASTNWQAPTGPSAMADLTIHVWLSGQTDSSTSVWPGWIMFLGRVIAKPAVPADAWIEEDPAGGVLPVEGASVNRPAAHCFPTPG